MTEAPPGALHDKSGFENVVRKSASSIQPIADLDILLQYR